MIFHKLFMSGTSVKTVCVCMFQTSLSNASMRYVPQMYKRVPRMILMSPSLFVIFPQNWHPASQQETLPAQFLFHVLSLVMAFAARLD